MRPEQEAPREAGRRPRRAAPPDRHRLVLPILQAACLVVGGTLVLVQGTLRVADLAEHRLQARPGDLLRIAPGSAPTLTSATVLVPVVSAPGLPAGASCAIGVGAAAAEGGSLLILRREAGGDYLAAWAGPGRSAAAGQDCGRTAELRLTQSELEVLREDQATIALLMPPGTGQ